MAQAELEGSSVLSQFRVDSDSEEDAGGHQVGGFADLRIKSEMVDDEPEFHGFTDSEIPAWVVDNFEDQDLKTGFSFNPTMFMSIVRSNKVTSAKQPPIEATPPNLMAVNIKTARKRNVEPNLGLDDPARQEKSPRVSVIKHHKSSISTIRNSAALGIPRADIEVEMLSRYTANKNVQAEMEKRDSESADTGETAPEPSSEGGVMYEVRVETETSVLLEDLELRLDNVVPGEGAAGGQEGAAQLLGGGAAGGQGAAAVLGQEGAAQLLGGGAAGGQGAAVRSSPAATCEVCGEHFEQKQQLYDHRKKHKSWCCKKCGKTIAGTTSLKLHKLHCSKDVPQYQCQICNYTSVSKTNFNRHLKIQHTVSPTKLHSCHVCDFETEAKTLLRKHLRTHTSRPKYECERCKRKFVNKEKFEQHVADHEKVTIRTSTGDYFKLEPRLGKNNRVQKFYCNCCDYSTPRMFDLKRHKWRKHERHEKCPETTENQIDIEDIIEMVCITGLSFRDVVKINRIVRRKFGKKAVEPNMTRKLRRMISNMGAWFETKKVIVKKKKKFITTYVSYVKDLNGFIKWIIEGRGYSDPQVSFSGDGGGSKYIITVHIVDKANQEQINNNNHRDTGSRLSLVVLQCDGGKREGTIENRENLEQFEALLKLAECDYAQTFTTDGKGLNIMTGLGGTSGTFNCAFGECFKVITFIYVLNCLNCNESLNYLDLLFQTDFYVYVQVDEVTGEPTNKRGLYVKKRRRTFRNMFGNNHRYKTIGKSNKSNMNKYFNCQYEPMMCGKWDKDDFILKRYPIEPLHIFLLGSPNDLLGLLKDEKDSEGNLIMDQFYEKHNLTMTEGRGGKYII